MDFSFFFAEQQKLLQKINLSFKRSLYSKINLKNRFIALLGQRGVGKTTIMLQILKEKFAYNDSVLYISVDNPYFASASLYDFAKEFEKYGGKFLFIDEIHKYKDFGSHLKAIYDSTDLNVIISGSSLLQIYKNNADLSRRIVTIKVPNMSFREYLELKGYNFPSYSLEEIVSKHVEIANDIISKIKPLKLFKEYLEYGAYPFIVEGVDTYKAKLINIINHILEVDLPYVTNIAYYNIDKLKKLLYILATSVPFTPNISELSQNTGISRPSVLEYIYLLEKAELLINMHYHSRGYSKLQKPDKIYLNNSNLMRAITYRTNTGNERETFFVNQVISYFFNKVSLLREDFALSKSGDFLINGKTFEIGGKRKGYKQIKEIPNSYIVADNIEIGFKNKIPLWLFGFLY
ncbi:ATP-binding protein [Deferribacter autotrophicus]|uniref:ATP-binding protein n=1 Tax=Deferribacter autotrophicus TaxID=500465 RepID=A0A5A8F152_9BACT|nr:AAA family ATPase [Deferribacter autotrophicus]KAA0257640.1 ATP-binding protein [Deferribacter autotrophicus]